MGKQVVLEARNLTPGPFPEKEGEKGISGECFFV